MISYKFQPDKNHFNLSFYSLYCIMNIWKKNCLLLNMSIAFLFLSMFASPCFSQNSEIGYVTKTEAKPFLQIDTIHNGLVVPKIKRTSLGLYVTAKEAFQMWEQSPAQVKVLDVRTLEEYIFIGHAEMAINAELFSQTHDWNEEKARYSLIPNPDFLDQVRDWAELQDVILVMCRSGGRSAMAVNLLASYGFIKVYNIINGMEGDTVSDPKSIYKGKRMKNGWKNSGLPWTYDLNNNQVLIKKNHTDH